MKGGGDTPFGSGRIAQATVDALQEHICVLDGSGVISAVNKAWHDFAQTNGLDPRRAGPGINYLAVCDATTGPDAELAAAFAAGIHAVMKNERDEFSLEYPCHSPDEQRWFIGRVTRLAGKGPSRLVVAHGDITERKRAEESLRESEEKFRAIADYTADWENWFSLDGRLLWVNPAVERVTGYSVAECLAMPGFPLPLSAGANRAEISALFQETISGTRGNDREFCFVHKDGTERWGAVSWQPIHSSDGTAMGYRTSVRDINERKRAEAAIRDSEKRFRLLVENVSDAIALLAPDGRFLYATPSASQINGYALEEFIGDNAFQAMHPEELPHLKQEFTQLLQRPGATISLQFRIRHRDGSWRWVAATASNQLAEPAIHAVVVNYRDITERKCAEEALLRSQTELKTIYEHAPTMMCVLDASRQVLYANNSFAEFVGRPMEEIKMERACGVIGCLRALDDLRGCGHGPRCETCAVRLAMVDALATGRSHHGIEYRTTALCRGQPRDSVFLTSVAPIQISGQPNLLLCLEDITERHRAQEALRESEENYRSLIATSLDAVLLTTPDGRILAANDAACRMFGSSEEEIIMAGRSGIIDTSDSRLTTALEECARTSKFRGELTFVRKDGTTFPGEVSSAIFTDRGGLAHTSMVIRDISERRRAEEELRSSHKQLRALATRLQAVREEERTQVAREIHDVLAQDLTRLKIDLAWLQRRLAKPEKAAAPEVLAARISQMSRMADAAINCVQRIATGLRPAVLDSLGLCAAVEWQARDFQDHTGIRCHAKVPEEELAIDRDSATAAFRILQESLTNVLRHAQATSVEVLLHQEANQLTLRIQDNGCGIQADRLNSPLSIGLAGMRERALLLGGQIEIRSRPGWGTTIDVRLPLSKEENLPEGKS